MSLDAVKKIGGPEEYRDSGGTRYECRFLVPDTLVNSFLPEIGSPADWTPERAYITGVVKTWVAEGVWSILLKAEKLDGEAELEAAGIYHRGLNGIAEGSYELEGIYFPPEWYGYRVAGKDDCTPFLNGPGQSGMIFPGSVKYKDVDGNWAKPGCYISISATPLYFSPATHQKVSDAARGENLNFSPFNGTLPRGYVNRTVQTRLFRCVFYTRRNMNSLNGFRGISGSFGAHCAPDNRRSGAWKALSQKIKRVSGPDGKAYFRVERTMLEAPPPLSWRGDECGGIWSW